MSPQTFLRERRRIGFRRAAANLNRRRHLLPVTGYLILAVATAGAFQQNADARDSFAEQNRANQLQGCERTNDLRANLVTIIDASVQLSTRAAERDTSIPDSQIQETRDFVKNAKSELGQIDCEKAYPPVG